MKKGIETLRAAVIKDCNAGDGCFSDNGCTKERYAYLPEDNPSLLSAGITRKCVATSKCTHDYCGKLKWVLERAAHYAEKTGKTVDEIIEAWEKDRDYWYMNYYQDCNQPLLTSETILTFDDWVDILKMKFGDDAKKWAFKCPSCGGTQTMQMFIDNNVENPNSRVYFSCIGRYVKGIGCNWTLGGLFQIHKTSVLKDAKVIPVFEMAD